MVCEKDILPSVCFQSDLPSYKSQAEKKKAGGVQLIQLILVWSLRDYGLGGLNCGVISGKKLELGSPDYVWPFIRKFWISVSLSFIA